MTDRRSSVVALGLAVATLAAAGCRKKPPPDPTLGDPGALPTAAPTASAPADRTTPDELAEGTDVAFGLKLPRGMLIQARFTDLLMAKGVVPADKVTNYIRQRVEVTRDHVVTGPAKTIFSKVSIKGSPGRLYGIEVVSTGTFTEVEVRDVTPPLVPKGASEEDLWRKSGLRPDGSQIDPLHTE